MNPIVPSGWDAALWVILLLALVLMVVTWLSIARSEISRTMKLVCALLVLAMPLVGSIVWFAGKKSLERSVNRSG